MLRVFIALLAWVLLAGSGRAQSPYAVAGISDARQVENFLGDLQHASRSEDRNAMASLIQYPMTVLIDGLRVPFSDSSALLDRYDAIFTLALRETIARAVAPDHPQPGRESMTVNPEGVIIGRNAVVIQQVGDRLRITGIVVPRPDPGVAAAALGARSEVSGRASLQEPRRVGVRIGPRPTQLAGALGAGASDGYMVWIPKGKVLEVRLERIQNRVAVVRVKHAATGAPLNPKTADGARVIIGQALEGADYRIDVERTESGESALLPYVLSLRLR
jgi:hypothetical protein